MSTSLRRALRRAALEAWLADADAVLATQSTPTATREPRSTELAVTELAATARPEGPVDRPSKTAPF